MLPQLILMTLLLENTGLDFYLLVRRELLKTIKKSAMDSLRYQIHLPLPFVILEIRALMKGHSRR